MIPEMAAIAVVASAILSLILWLFGVGVSSAFHQAMGIWFVIVHIIAVVIISQSDRRPWIGLVAAISIVPTEVLSIFVGGMVEAALK